MLCSSYFRHDFQIGASILICNTYLGIPYWGTITKLGYQFQIGVPIPNWSTNSKLGYQFHSIQGYQLLRYQFASKFRSGTYLNFKLVYQFSNWVKNFKLGCQFSSLGTNCFLGIPLPNWGTVYNISMLGTNSIPNWGTNTKLGVPIPNYGTNFLPNLSRIGTYLNSKLGYQF